MHKAGSLKSQNLNRPYVLKVCLGLSTELLVDILQQAGLDFKRDVSTLRSRTNQEGLGFLTKTLPSMGKALQSALLGNRLSIPQFKCVSGTVIPHFLKGLLSRVFHPDGKVRCDADICALTDLIQFCLLHYKLEVPYDPKTMDKVLSKFIHTDAIAPESFEHLGDPDIRLESDVLRVASSLISRLFAGFDPKNIKPRHGPGAVATGELPHQKMQFKRIFDSVEAFYPTTEYFFLGDRHLFDCWEKGYWDLSHIPEPAAKVALVPKDSRGPRLISAEPLELQFLQQGLGRKLVAWIEHNPLTRGHVNFTDQTINQRLALLGSIDGAWATLDMKDASDRVSLALVETLFDGTGFLPYLKALRSTSTFLPDGREVRLRKYAPMGSALCFPVESVCFWALAAACIHVFGSIALKKAVQSVYVYGDDIIVKGGFEKYLLQNFQYYGLRFNTGKCCYTGSFRESCGCDAFRGHWISPIRLKKLPLGSYEEHSKPKKGNKLKCKSTVALIDGAQLVSWIAVSNLLFQRGYYRASDFCKKHVESMSGISFPLSMRDPQRTLNPWEAHNAHDQRHFPNGGGSVTLGDSALCWYVRQIPDHSDQVDAIGKVPIKVRYNSDLQRYEYLAWTVSPINYVFKGNSDWSELFRHFIADLGTKPHLYSFLRRVKLKRKWTSLAY